VNNALKPSYFYDQNNYSILGTETETSENKILLWNKYELLIVVKGIILCTKDTCIGNEI